MEIVENILQSNHEVKEETANCHALTEKYSNCELCGNTFSDEEDLKLHIKVKRGKNITNVNLVRILFLMRMT